MGKKNVSVSNRPLDEYEVWSYQADLLIKAGASEEELSLLHDAFQRGHIYEYLNIPKKSASLFENPRYEYTTRECPTIPGQITPDFEASLEAVGWHRAWADITVEGTFIVYRRLRKDTR